MKKSICLIVVIFLLSLSFTHDIGADESTLQKTIYVDDDRGVNYTKIQEEKDYNFLIITPGDFSDELQPLVGHKKQYGIITKIVTLDDVYESVYFPVNGRDNAEKIKYFIKSAKENWNTNYVMLVGGKEDMPVRFVENIFGRHYNLFICDLYFADIYNKKWEFLQLGFKSK